MVMGEGGAEKPHPHGWFATEPAWQLAAVVPTLTATAERFRTTHTIPTGDCTAIPFYRWENSGTGRPDDLASGGSKPQRETPLSEMPLPPPCKGPALPRGRVVSALSRGVRTQVPAPPPGQGSVQPLTCPAQTLPRPTARPAQLLLSLSAMPTPLFPTF